MAKFLAILGNISGSIGANTFSHNRGGSYVKRRSVPTNPNSNRQQDIRNILSSLSSNWSSLSSANQNDWNTWAYWHPKIDPLGNAVSITGAQAYAGLNCRLLDSGESAIDTAPTITAPMGLTTFSIARTTDTTATVTFAPDPLGTDDKIQLWASLPFSGARNPNRAQARLVGYSDAAEESPWVVTLPFTWTVGNTIVFYGVIMGVDGQISVEQQFRVTA